MRHAQAPILFGNSYYIDNQLLRFLMLTPGKHLILPIKLCDHVPEVPEVPPKDVPLVPEVPVVPHTVKLVWQQRITLVTFLYKTITDLPNNIRMGSTGMNC
jgi:hypothetical protein